MRLTWQEAMIFLTLGVGVLLLLYLSTRSTTPPTEPEPAPVTHTGESIDPPTSDDAGSDPTTVDPKDTETDTSTDSNSSKLDPLPEDPDANSPDPVTPSPEEILSKRVGEVIAETKATGDVRKALQTLDGVDETLSQQETIATIRAWLSSALTRPRDTVSSEHPAADAWNQERDAASKQLDQLVAMVSSPPQPGTLTTDVLATQLIAASADTVQRTWTEQFFALPSDTPVKSPDLTNLPEPADRAAATILRAWDTLDASEREAASLAMAAKFRAANRMRARLRWLHRAYASRPSRRVIDRLSAAHIENEEQHSAFLLLGVSIARLDRKLLERRATVAGWLSRTHEEADALRRLPDEALTIAQRKRLVVALMAQVKFSVALAHARRLVAAQPSEEHIKLAIHVALSAGNIDAALDFYRVAWSQDNNPRPWKEDAYRIALQDLRLDRAGDILKSLYDAYPRGTFAGSDSVRYADELLDLYLKTDDRDKLRVLLTKELAVVEDGASKQRLRVRLANLHLASQDVEKASAIYRDTYAAIERADDYLRLADYLSAAKLSSEQAMQNVERLLAHEATTPEQGIDLLYVHRDIVEDDDLESLFDALAKRFPDSEQVRKERLFHLDAKDPKRAAALERARALAENGDEDAIRDWVKRATWTDDSALKIEAREALFRVAPQDVSNMRALASLYGADDRGDEALPLLRALADASGDTSEDAERYVQALLDNESFHEALPLVRKQFRANPSQKDALDRYLYALEGTKAYAEALPYLQTRAHRADANEEDIARYITALEELKRLPEAIALLQARARRPDATRSDFRRLLAALLAAKRNEEMVAVYERLVRHRDATRDDRREYAGALVDAKRVDDAVRVWRTLYEEPDATRTDHIRYAEVLVTADRVAQAVPIYKALLVTQPRDGLVLRRLGEAYGVVGRPRMAIPYLKLRLAIAPHELKEDERRARGQVRYLLGENYWSLRHRTLAKRHFRVALAAQRALSDRSIGEETTLARCLMRLGPEAEGCRRFRELRAKHPDEIAIPLDLVDGLIGNERFSAARRVWREASQLEPENRRLLRQDANLKLHEHRPADAAEVLKRVIRTGPPPAPNFWGEYATALQYSGRVQAASRMYARQLALAPDSNETRRQLRSNLFDTERTATAFSRHRFAADDRTSYTGISATVPLLIDRLRAVVSGTQASTEGIATGTPGNKIGDDFWQLQTDLHYRIHGTTWAMIGADVYDDRVRGPDAGVRASITTTGSLPYWSLSLEGHYDTIMDETGAAPALGGRKRGVRATVHREFDTCYWLHATASFDRFGAHVPGHGLAWDGWASWSVEAGRRLFELPCELSVRLNYSATRHLDDRRLAEVLPLGKRTDFLTAGLRAKRRLAQVVDATAEFYAGFDPHAAGLLWGLEGGLEWQLHRCARVRATFGYGSNSEFQDGDFGHVSIFFDWFW